MAEEQSSGEKTEEPTPKRLRDARKKGQVAKSRDVNTIVIMITAFAMVAVMHEYMGSQIQEIMNANFQVGAMKGDIIDEEIMQYGVTAFKTYIKIVAPYMAVLVFVAFAIGFAQVGAIFTTEPLKPKMDKFNIVKNVKNMMKITTLVELLKNVAKMIIIFLIAFFVISDNLREIVLTVSGEPYQAASIAGMIFGKFLIRVFICFAIIALLDLAVQRWHYKKQLKMTKDEVKREYKQDEGDPLIKSMRRQLHRELAMSDTRQAVGASDAVITNPLELAVAVKYDESEMMAPQIMARGQRLFAEQIKDFAKDQDVPVVRNVPLAWALIELEIGDEIPEDLYAAVAEILSIVYKMRGDKRAEA
ncbi:EscU/YscU/HrcU family type III secretion system export apparatus switch protein [bacterium]|nr:EscU/YscU/HrcU family type III secretion system export apparatus switch protein [bacterium]